MGKNYNYMVNALWYPYSLLSSPSGALSSSTIRPYDINFNDLSQGVIPGANGGTNPTGGFMTAYNQFSSNSGQGFTGRTGAAKLVIFETDGVAHDYYTPTLTNLGANQSYYTFGANVDEAVSSNINMSSKSVPITVVQQICALTTANPPGYSTSRLPARVHALGFGEMFEPYLTSDTTAGPMQSCALQFLLNVEAAGGTAFSTDTIQTVWGYPGTATGPGGTGGYTTGTQSFKIIVGDYNTRIGLIKNALRRIMQSGIQVALIQ
jgi:hypothetical protein